MAKSRITVDLQPDTLHRLEDAALRLRLSRNEAAEELIRRSLQALAYRCPICRTICYAGEPGCEHFDPQDVTWGKE